MQAASADDDETGDGEVTPEPPPDALDAEGEASWP
jgi:hypothetical protein